MPEHPLLIQPPTPPLHSGFVGTVGSTDITLLSSFAACFWLLFVTRICSLGFLVFRGCCGKASVFGADLGHFLQKVARRCWVLTHGSEMPLLKVGSPGGWGIPAGRCGGAVRWRGWREGDPGSRPLQMGTRRMPVTACHGGQVFGRTGTREFQESENFLSLVYQTNNNDRS